MRVFIVTFLVFLSSVSPTMSCETPDKPSVEFARAADVYDDCIEVYMSFPERLDVLEALAPRLIIKSADGNGLTVDLYSMRSEFREGEQLAYACLSEQALREARILIQYMNFTPQASTAWDCMQTVELNQLDKLLAESDKAKAQK